MESNERRRRDFFDELFEADNGEFPFEIRPLRVGALARFAPAEPIVKLFDGDDELFVEPGLIAVLADTEAAATLAERTDLDSLTGDVADGSTIVFAVRGREENPVGAAAQSIAIIAELTGERDALGRTVIAPVHGFLAHQKVGNGTDPELTRPVTFPSFGSGVGSGRSALILDTGLAQVRAWPLNIGASDPDDLVGVTSSPLLGRAAGHGTFIAGLIAQLAPDTEITVRRIANTEGFVSERSLSDLLVDLARQDPPDVVVLAFGGYSLLLGSWGIAGNKDQWIQPLVLRSALQDLVAAWPNTLFVASAGNSDSPDPSFPAAFAVDRTFDNRLVSVAALDDGGFRWANSNFGSWVTASTLGVRLRSMFVVGTENSVNDPTTVTPEKWILPAYARWSGTSFAAAVVAGRVLETLATDGSVPTAPQAWGKLRSFAARQREGLGGVVVDAAGVARD